jgi:hypothetical protein
MRTRIFSPAPVGIGAYRRVATLVDSTLSSTATSRLLPARTLENTASHTASRSPPAAASEHPDHLKTTRAWRMARKTDRAHEGGCVRES